MDSVTPAPGPRRAPMLSPRWMTSPWIGPLLVLAVSLTLTIWAWRATARGSAEVARTNFLRQRDNVIHRLQDRLSDCEYMLMGGAGVFFASEDVTRAEWRSYVEALRPEEKLEGVQGVGFAQRIRSADLPAHLARVRAEGFPDYTVRPEGPREEYTAIIYLEPFRDRNLRAFGYDMFTEPVRRAAMERARDEGHAAMTGRVVLVQEVPGQPMQYGFLIYVPVYANQLPHTTVEQRRAALAGFVYSPFRAGDFVEHAILAESALLEVEIYDGDQVAADHLLYTTRGNPQAERIPGGYRPVFREALPVVLLGRTWTVQFSSLPSFDAAQHSSRAPFTLAVGLFCSLLGTGITAVLAARNRALQQVGRMTAALQQARDELERRVRDRTAELSRANARLERDIVARRQAENELASVSAHYHQLLSVASDGIHVLDADGRLVEWSDSFRRMLGYSPEKMRGLKVADWDAHFSKEELLRRIRDLIDHPAVFDTRHRRQDGTVFDVEINASGVELEGRTYLYCSSRDITERKQTEAAMRRAAEEIQDLYNRAPCGYHSLNRDGVIVQINDTELEWLGYSRGEVVGKRRMPEFLTPDSRRRFQESFPQFLATGSISDVELDLVRRDGSVFTVLVNGTAIRDAQGQVSFSRSTLYDISERKRAEAALRESEARFGAMADSAPVLIWVAGLDKKCSYFNRTWLEFTGRTLAQEVGDGWAEGVHPDDLHACVGRYVEAFDARQPFRMEYRLRRHDGEYRWIIDHGTPRFGPEGEFAGYIGSCFDITELRRAEDRLRLQGAAMEAAASTIMITAVDGTIQWVNPAFSKASGYAFEDAVGNKPSLVRSGIHPPEFYRQMWATILRGDVWRGEVRNKRKDGSLYDEELTITPVRDAQGHITHFIAIKSDISARKRVEETRQAAAAYARSLIEASLDPLVTINVLGMITDVNEASVQITGVPRERLIGTDFSNYFTEPAKAREGYLRVFAEGSVHDYPLALRHVSGRVHDVLYNASVYRDPHGNVVGVFAAARDVTLRNKAERELQAASAYARSLIEASLDPLVTIDARGRITDVNDALVQATGVPRAQLIGTDFSNYFTDPAQADAGYRQVFAEGQVRDYPLTLRHASGQVREVLYNASVYRDAQGDVVGVFAAARDVTERKRMEDALRRNEMQLRAILESSPTSLAINDSAGRVLFLNRKFVETFGYTRDDIPTLAQWWPLAYPDPVYRQRVETEWMQAIERQQRVGGPLRFSNIRVTGKDGTVRDVDFEAVSVGEIVLVVMIDTTERNRLLEQTAEDARAKSELLREVNHRVANNLTSILGLIVGENGAVAAAQRPAVKPVLDRLSQRIRGLLDAHRMLSDMKWAPVQICRLADQVIRAAVGADPRRPDVTLRIGTCRTVVSPRQASNLALILNELATNTVKYGRVGAGPLVIAVNCESDAEFVTVRFADNGPGFPPEVLAGQRANIGLQLVRQLTRETLRGELTLANRPGAEVVLRFRVEEGYRT